MRLLNLITISIFVALSSTSFAQRVSLEAKTKTLSAPSLKSFKVKGTIPSALRGGTSGVGGGGNTLNGKLIENYVFDITTTPAYKMVVAPLLARFESRFKQGEYVQFLLKSLQLSSAEIAWYMVPTELKELTTNFTGLPFPSEQLAVQTDAGEVWVDKNMFAKNDLNEQALLIMHEIVLRAAVNSNNVVADSGSYSPCSQATIMKKVRLTTIFLFDSRALSLSDQEYVNAVNGLGWFLDIPTCNIRSPEF